MILRSKRLCIKIEYANQQPVGEYLLFLWHQMVSLMNEKIRNVRYFLHLFRIHSATSTRQSIK